MNNVTILGRLVRDVELNETQSGLKVAKFTLAVDRMNKKELETQGKQTADFINCVAFGKQADAISAFSRKGGRILINGRIQTGSYEKNDGTKVYTTDVIVGQYNILDWTDSNSQPSTDDFMPNDEEDNRIPF